MSLAALDTLVCNRIALRELVNFDFAGRTWVASAGSRDTIKSLEMGGTITDQTVSLLVPIDQFTAANVTAPTEKKTIDLYVTADGIPCAKETTGSTTVSARISRISRSGGAFTWELSTSKR
jgi:hypothetical protein